MTRFDRIALVVLAAVTPTWRNVLRIVQPETLLRWHRVGFKGLWRWRSRPGPKLRVAPEAIALIRSMASDNALYVKRAGMWSFDDRNRRAGSLGSSSFT
jgi:hypothetical protein